MNNRLVLLPILPVLFLSLLSVDPLRAADPAPGATAPSETTQTDAPPVPTVPSTPEAPSPGQTSAAASSSSSAVPTENPTTYTVVTGDTLWVVSHKFSTSIKKLKKLNHLKKDQLKPGQILKIPSNKASHTSTKKTSKSSHKVKAVTSHHAQPVQDFDLPASTFASCPEPAAVPEPESTTSFVPAEAHASVPVPLAKAAPTYLDPSGPLQAGFDQAVITPTPASIEIAVLAPRHAAKNTTPSARASNAPAVTFSSPTLSPAPAPTAPAKRGLFNFFYTPPPSVDWGARFTQAARELGDRGLDYNDDWRPPGESRSWSMDCSNTARYLYRATTGIQLPRTASDQYYYLHLQNKAWDVPQAANGFADCNFLRQNLKAGDLLFWENTYKPDRQPPITHVMIFLGTNARGQWIMAGSQSSRGGEHNRRHGGPDIYVFNPTRACGGYTTWMGFVHHQGRFCAYGRPLEADKSKLAVAAND